MHSNVIPWTPFLTGEISPSADLQSYLQIGQDVLIHKKKTQKTSHLVDFSSQRTIEWKWKREKIWSNRELKTLWNIRVIIISFIVGAIEIVSKSKEKKLAELEIIERFETIENRALLKSVRILRRVSGI